VVAAKPTPTPPPGPATPIQIYGAWHCGNHYCDWAPVRDLAEFDQANRWLIDRGDGRPSVNLVVLSFVHPLRLLEQGDTGLFNMIPAGMTQDVVDYFKSRGVRVMLSIGGITYTDAWDQRARRFGEDRGASGITLTLNPHPPCRAVEGCSSAPAGRSESAPPLTSFARSARRGPGRALAVRTSGCPSAARP
jgi:hypothetical protein